MKVQINGKPVELAQGMTVDQLLIDQKAQTPEYVTVELNGEILDRESFAEVSVKDGDAIEFLYFMGGGA